MVIVPNKEFFHRTGKCILHPVQCEWCHLTAVGLLGRLGVLHCVLMATSSVFSGEKEIVNQFLQSRSLDTESKW